MIGYFLQGAGVVSRGSSQVDLSAVGAIGPILAFVLVVVIVFVLLKNAEILGDSPWVAIIVALVIGFAFVAAGKAVSLVLAVGPWFAVLLITLFLFLLFGGIVGKTDMFGKGIVWVFVLALVGVFIVSAVKVFGTGFTGYLPGPYFGISGDPGLLFFFDWLYSPAISGGISLIVVAIVVAWVLVKLK